MSDKKDMQADDLVSALDNFFKNGGGHAEVKVESDSKDKTITISLNECADGKNACGIPTELEDIDSEED